MLLEQEFTAHNVSSGDDLASPSAARVYLRKGSHEQNGDAPASAEPWHSVCGSAAWMHAVEVADRYAHACDPVSIVGECGTGKRYIVERIWSQRHAQGLMRIACGKLSAELATCGMSSWVEWKVAINEALQRGNSMWWLDGIDELPVSHQSLVFELLHEIRGNHAGQLPVACTSKLPLFEMLETDRIQEDLYYALAVHEIDLPPLRDRPSDILALTTHFSAAPIEGAPAIRFSREAIATLSDYDWPGNVRELRNIVAHVRVLADRTVIDSDQLLSMWRRPRRTTADLTTLNLEEAETQLILKAVERSGGNKTAAAKHLGITARTLHNKMQKYKSLGLIADPD